MEGVGGGGFIKGVKQLKKKKKERSKSSGSLPRGGGGPAVCIFFFFFSPNILIVRELYQTVSKVYFTLGISTTDLWSHIVFPMYRRYIKGR